MERREQPRVGRGGRTDGAQDGAQVHKNGRWTVALSSVWRMFGCLTSGTLGGAKSGQDTRREAERDHTKSQGKTRRELEKKAQKSAEETGRRPSWPLAGRGGKGEVRMSRRRRTGLKNAGRMLGASQK